MKWLFLSLGLGLILLLAAVGIVFQYGGLSAPPPSVIDHNLLGCKVTMLDGSDLMCFAVPYREEDDKLVLLSAKHFFDPQKQYQIIFDNGVRRKIEKVDFPLKNHDVALVTIDRNQLQKGTEYEIPVFVSLEKQLVNAHVFIYHDKFYGVSKRIINKILPQEHGLLIAGKIEKGRSGSPVFLTDSNKCIGIVSGYFATEKQADEQIMVVSMP